MKKLKFVLLLLVAVSFSCSEEAKVTTPWEGEWSLVNVKAGTTVDDFFANGTITWTFNSNDEKITIVNNNVEEELQDILPSGVYDYELFESGGNPQFCGLTMKIEDVDYGCLALVGSYFIIGPREDDGYNLYFQRTFPLVD